MKRLLRRGDVIRLGGVPVNDVPEGGDVVGTAILIIQIVSVLPHIDADDGFALEAGNRLAHEGAVLIGGRADRELLVMADDEPGPAGAETGRGGLGEVFLELGEAAEFGVDRRGEPALGRAALAGTENLPEERMVGVTARVVADAATDGVGHLGEIGESLLQLQPAEDVQVQFVPWRGDFTRGIFISSTLHCEWSIEELTKLYEDYYESHPFTKVSCDAIFLKQVVNTNKAVVQLEKAGSKLVVHSVIDNLVKGASGQAVQNMNLICGWPETTGLKLKASYF